MLGAGLLVLLLLVLLVVVQMRIALGQGRGVALGLLGVLVAGSAWGMLELTQRNEPPPPEDPASMPPVSSETCFKCHEPHYASWHRTFHRTMTREATPENIKADFNDVEFEYRGVSSRMFREGDRFFMDTIDPDWSRQLVSRGIPLEKAGPIVRRVLSVDRVIGSHWFQYLLHRDEQGRYTGLPLEYHLVEKRWIHVNGGTLGPDSPHFFSQPFIWNAHCIYCHNTRPSSNPEPIRGQPDGYRTEVGELGIACEACHGPAERHVDAHQNPARRLAQRYSEEGDPTIVNPARLSVARCDDVCAHCHGRYFRRPEAWNRTTYADPFIPGQDLARVARQFWSEAELFAVMKSYDPTVDSSKYSQKPDGHFWGDGTPLTTAIEFKGMALSACYQNGQGQMRCLTCHSMHQAEPNHQVKDGMRTNAACYGCHESYRARLVEHTHHAEDSPGSLCMNCHMPHQVYSLLTTHRSHRITIPRVRDSIGTGKPHACNLCHLDKSLGWTDDQLGTWYGTKSEPLSEEDRTFASSLLHLTRSDARSRAVVAGAFSSPDAQKASGRDWPGPLLTRLLEHERYQAVRYLLHRSLRSLHGAQANAYDYQGAPAKRAAQVHELQRMAEQGPRPDRRRYPYLPLSDAGLFSDDALNRLLRMRSDPDVSINE